LSRLRPIHWFILGFLAASVLAAVVEPSAAHAQGRRGGPMLRPTDTDTGAPSPASADPFADASRRPGDGEAGAINPGEDPLPDDEEGAGRPLPAGMRPAVRDGDVGVATETAPAADGLVATDEPPAMPDGVDQTKFDTRAADDIAAFENPPAGYDPLLFQIEDIEPLRDRRVARLARFEPFDPVGIRIGSFVLFPEVDLATAYISNVFRSGTPKGDFALEARPSVRLVSDWASHAFEVKASGGLSYFDQYDSEDDRSYRIEARTRLDITRRANIQGEVSRDVKQESRSVLEASRVGSRADVTTDRAALSYNQRFNRVSLQLRGTASEVDYGPVTTNGLTSSNSDRSYRETSEAVRATYEFKPTLSPFSEVELVQREHAAPSADGITRSSTGQRYRVGLSFGQTGKILRGEVSVGYGVQNSRNAALPDVTGFIADANLAWRITGLTSLLLTARSDVGETNIAGSSGTMSRQAGLELRHSFRDYLIGSAGLSYTVQDYSGLPIEERELALKLGVEYFLNRDVVFYGKYQHTRFDTTVADADYDNDELRVGMKLRR
jgi:hypothetical protein